MKKSPFFFALQTRSSGNRPHVVSQGTFSFQLENNNVLDAESECGLLIEAELELNMTTAPRNSAQVTEMSHTLRNGQPQRSARRAAQSSNTTGIFLFLLFVFGIVLASSMYSILQNKEILDRKEKTSRVPHCLPRLVVHTHGRVCVCVRGCFNCRYRKVTEGS